MKISNRSQPLLPLLTAATLSLCLGCASLPSLSSLSPAALKSGLFQSSGERASEADNRTSKPPITSAQEVALTEQAISDEAGQFENWSEEPSGVRQANFQSYQDPQDMQIPPEELRAMQEADAMRGNTAEMQGGYSYQEGQAIPPSSMSVGQAQAGVQTMQQGMGHHGQPMMPAQGMDTNRLAIGQLRGREFRPRLQTANELMIACNEKNKLLQAQLQICADEKRDLNTRIEIQNQAVAELQLQLEEASGMIRDLRQQVAKFQIQNETLRNEKVMIKQNADRALRRIEAELDALLLRSVSKAIETTENGR